MTAETEQRTVSSPGPGALRTLERKFELYLGVVFVLALTVLILADIVNRNVNGRSFLWLRPGVIGIMVWLTWVAAAGAIRNNSHLRFTLVYERLPRTGKYLAHVVEWITWLVFAGVIFRFSIPIIQRKMEINALILGTPLPKWLIYLGVPVGFGLIIVRVLQQAYLVTRDFLEGEEISYEEVSGLE